MPVIREALSAVARNESLGGILNRTPMARSVVRRVVAGETVDEALAVAAELADTGFWVSLERSAPVVESDEDATRVLADYLDLVTRVGAADLAGTCEVSVFAESLGELEHAGAESTRARLAELCEHASAHGVHVMVGMGPAADVDRTIEWVAELQERGLLVGLTLQACMKRTEADCSRFADRRVRLVKGSHRDGSVATYAQPIELDKAFVRCVKLLLKGTGSPSFATHDPRLIEIIEALAVRYERAKQTYEFAFFMGRLEAAQARLSANGDRVRVYVPYGPDWFARLVGGLAEQPSSIAAAVRSLLPGSTS